MLGTCNTCVRLHSRVTSSGATVNSWMIFFYLFIFLYFILCLFIFSFLSFACLLCLFSFCDCWFCFYFLLAYFWLSVLSLSFFSLFVYFKHSFHFIVVGLGLIFHWSENKISYFGVVYKFFSVAMELAVIKELFIILYI